MKYIELKTGYSDNGTAWIGKVEFSKSGKTIYFHGHAFKGNGLGISRDLETGDLKQRNFWRIFKMITN